VFHSVGATQAYCDRSVITAEDGEAALRICEEAKQPIDIIISDVFMPRLDGFGLCNKIRAMPRYNSSAVISTYR
jgi:CheY-like chemotaxis protein